MKKILYSLLNILLGTLVGGLLYLSITILYEKNFSQGAQDEYIREIYDKIQAQTGQNQNSLPLVIDDALTVNAYNDGSKVVIYRGLINDTRSWDEIALILGHETAHGMLGHLSNWTPNNLNPDSSSVLEANADKMGAFYMMKAGFNICKGREIWKRWRQKGDALGQDHPDYAYRYAELNINCE